MVSDHGRPIESKLLSLGNASADLPQNHLDVGGRRGRGPRRLADGLTRTPPRLARPPARESAARFVARAVPRGAALRLDPKRAGAKLSDRRAKEKPSHDRTQGNEQSDTSVCVDPKGPRGEVSREAARYDKVQDRHTEW